MKSKLQQQGESGIFRPVNRIDKNTSGLVLCAKNAFAAPLLAGSAHKCYLAIVQGTMPLGPGRVEAPIARRGDSIIGRCVCADGKYSLTEYAVLAAGPGHSLLACWPRTGPGAARGLCSPAKANRKAAAVCCWPVWRSLFSIRMCTWIRWC